ncbi:MAG: restriction endonuclease subunit S [Acidobacteria bacterium]|nr:restriction endonuclease subunit S [Acidobacteriota bacterium]
MPTSDRRVVTLGQLIDSGCASLQTGPFGSQLHASDYVPSGVALIPTEAIGRRSIRDSVLPQVSEETAARLSRHFLQAGDILFARRGVQATGLSAIVTDRHAGALCSTGAIRLRVSSPDVDPAFVSFWLSTPRSVEWIKAHAVGGVMPNVNESVLRLLPLELPLVDVQIEIAGLLGRMDEKIRVNSDVNNKLETLATALFRSWFVDFDPVVAKRDGRMPVGVPSDVFDLFSSHFEDSELGPIPQGWRVASVGEICELRYGKALPERSRQTGKVPVLGSNGVVGWHNGALVAGPGIVVGRKGTAGTVTWVSTDFFPIDTTFYVVPKANMPMSWISEALRDLALERHAGDSAVPGLNRDSANSQQVIRPPDSLLRAFDDLWCSMRQLRDHNDVENKTLAELRDSLIGPLLSGELTLNKAENAVGAVL